MQRPPTTGTSISVLAAELAVPAQRVLRTAWELGDIPALTEQTLVSAPDADRIRARCTTASASASAAAPVTAGVPSSRAPARTAGGHVIPAPSPPTGDFARLQALRATAKPAEEDDLAPLRRALGADTGSARVSRPREGRRSRAAPPWTRLAAEFKRRYPGYATGDLNSAAREWTDRLIKKHFADLEDVVAWLDAGYGPSRLEEVIRLHQAGIRAQLLEVRVAGRDTVRSMLRRGEPEHLIGRLLRDQGLV